MNATTTRLSAGEIADRGSTMNARIAGVTGANRGIGMERESCGPPICPTMVRPAASSATAGPSPGERRSISPLVSDEAPR